MTNSSECSNDLKIENGMARCSLFTGELPKDLYIPRQIVSLTQSRSHGLDMRAFEKCLICILIWFLFFNF